MSVRAESLLEPATGRNESWNVRKVQGISLYCQPPDPGPVGDTYCDYDGHIQRAAAALLPLAGCDPLHVLFLGPTGAGKTAAAQETARVMGLPSWTLAGHPCEAEDLVASAVFVDTKTIRYVASPLLAAFIEPGGGVAIFDEIAKAGRGTTEALAPLASALDHRRVTHSTLLQHTFTVGDGARFLATAQSDEALPEWLRSRCVRITLSLAPPEVLMDIVGRRCPPGGSESLRSAFLDWLLSTEERVSPRRAIGVLHLAARLLLKGDAKRPSPKELAAAIALAATHF